MNKLTVLALTLASALSAGSCLAQSAPPSGYLSLDQYGQAKDSAVPAVAKPGALFEATRGASLRATLEKWVADAGWQPLAWKLPDETDFTLGASAKFQGDLVTATKAFIEALGPEAELRVRFNSGNRLVVVEPLK